ncbi:hypothetical protein GCM10009646_68340 [Streptomyces aureus]
MLGPAHGLLQAEFCQVGPAAGLFRGSLLLALRPAPDLANVRVLVAVTRG